MTLFKLPDLGEGLPDAEIHEWFVKVGDTVALDQALVSMETAKAIVDVPAPQAGKITRIFGEVGEIIKTGAPLLEFESDQVSPDAGTVVGKIEESGALLEEHFSIGASDSTRNAKVYLATTQARALAQSEHITLDKIPGSGPQGLITLQDVENYLATPPEGYHSIKGVRRHMITSMTLSHQQVVPASIVDDVDISHWIENSDITVRLIQAISYASEKEPALNAWYDNRSQSIKLHSDVNVGLAVDTEEGLFVPVIKAANRANTASLRQEIDRLKKAIHDRSLANEALQGASITLSNFGKFAGRYATPVIVPPSVAILAVGACRPAPLMTSGQMQIGKSLPLSLSFDHRAVTGGEASRFLAYVMESLRA